MKGSYVRRSAHWMIMSLFLAVAGCGGDTGTNGGDDNGGGGGGTNPVVTTDVMVGSGGNVFTPPDIQVSPGATVTWTWANSVTHNVTFTDNTIDDSGDQAGGMYSTAMPATAGTYNYVCTIHQGMDGSVLVVQ